MPNKEGQRLPEERRPVRPEMPDIWRRGQREVGQQLRALQARNGQRRLQAVRTPKLHVPVVIRRGRHQERGVLSEACQAGNGQRSCLRVVDHFLCDFSKLPAHSQSPGRNGFSRRYHIRSS